MLVHRYPALVAESQPETAVRMTPRMWRSLLLRPLLPPGSSVLVAGEHPLDAIGLLVDLAYNVTGLCESPDAVITGRRNIPKADFCHWRSDDRGLPDAARFDMVLVTDAATYADNLYASSSRLQTCRLLALLKPQSRLVFLRRVGTQAQHAVACWQRHLGCFPGQVHSTVFQSGWSRWLKWFPLRAPAAESSLLALTLQTPTDSLTLDDWKRFARRGLLTDRRVCCPTAAAEVTDLATGRVA